MYNATYVKQFPITSITRRVQPAASPPEFRIVLYFACKSVSSLFVLNQEYSDQPVLVRRDPHPIVIKAVVLDLHQFLDQENARQIIGNKLRELHTTMGDTVRQRWVESALKKAREAVLSMPAQHNLVAIKFKVILTVAFIDDQTLQVEEMVDGNNYMVPAAGSWIDQTLGRMTVTEYSGDRTCAVCLEDFSGGGGGCEVVSMPCAHYFHGDCIGKWLRTSHYCPVCRFKVPTELEMLKDSCN